MKFRHLFCIWTLYIISVNFTTFSILVCTPLNNLAISITGWHIFYFFQWNLGIFKCDSKRPKTFCILTLYINSGYFSISSILAYTALNNLGTFYYSMLYFVSNSLQILFGHCIIIYTSQFVSFISILASTLLNSLWTFYYSTSHVISTSRCSVLFCCIPHFVGFFD